MLVNKEARHEYEVLATYEAGMVLSGDEVKSLRAGRASINEAFVRVVNGEAFLINASILRYQFAEDREYDPVRSRKLLFHKKELLDLDQKMQGANLTLIPLKVYTKRNRYKLEVGLARGKKTHEKRESLKKRDLEREVRKDFKAKLR